MPDSTEDDQSSGPEDWVDPPDGPDSVLPHLEHDGIVDVPPAPTPGWNDPPPAPTEEQLAEAKKKAAEAERAASARHGKAMSDAGGFIRELMEPDDDTGEAGAWERLEAER